MNLPCLLKFTEKHGERLFLIMSKEDALAAFKAIFDERLTAGYWYISREPKKPEKPSIPADITDAKAMGSYAYKLNRYDDSLKTYENQLAEFYMIEKIRETSDVNLIVRFMNARKDYQYEEFEYEQFENYPRKA